MDHVIVLHLLDSDYPFRGSILAFSGLILLFTGAVNQVHLSCLHLCLLMLVILLDEKKVYSHFSQCFIFCCNDVNHNKLLYSFLVML